MSSFINSSLLYEDIEDFYLQKKKYPHCLILLSSKEYSNLKQNSAHVTDINCTNKKWIKYKNITYVGSNLNFKKKSMHLHNSVTQVQYIDLSKCSKRIFCITTTVRDILSADPDTIIIPSASRYRNNSHEVSIIGDDGVVLLYYAIIAKRAKMFPMKFDYDFATKI